MEILHEEKAFIDLFDNFIQTGEVIWLGIRSQPREPIQSKGEIFAEIGGVKNDHSNKGNNESKRQATIFQYEYLQIVASFLGKKNIDPSQVRRNIVVKGLNLNALKGKQFRIGEAIFEMTGFCHPCDLMEENLGRGGYNAMRGHGGITCRVIKEGKIKTGDRVEVIISQ
jgi:MOSC domain-containing protein YiiM